MNLNLLIKYLDGNNKEVVATPADIVAFEAKFDLSVARLQENIRFTHFFFIAWHVEKRTKATGLEFEPWLETVEMVEPQPVKK
jgi:hypothetical protein